MKIGLVSSEPFYFPGGVQEHVRGLYRFFNSKGHKVKIIAPRYREEENYGKNVILVGDSFKFSWNGSKGNISYCFDMEELRAILDKENFDVLHFHNTGLFTGLEILSLSHSTNVITLHALPDHSLFYNFTRPFINLFAKGVSDRFAGVIVISKPLLDYFGFLKKHVDGHLAVIPSGIDMKRFRPDNKKIEEFVDGKKNILFVGRLDKRKGLPYLIDAFRMVKRKADGVRLIIVGDGDDREMWERDVEKMNLTDVVFVGSQTNEDLPRYYATADIFCSPAVKGESFGVVLLEAMSSGKPIVAFANKGYREVLRDYDSRFLVKPKNTHGLANAILTLVNDRKLREKLGRWGLKESRKYSWDVVGERVLKFYERIQSNSI